MFSIIKKRCQDLYWELQTLGPESGIVHAICAAVFAAALVIAALTALGLVTGHLSW